MTFHDRNQAVLPDHRVVDVVHEDGTPVITCHCGIPVHGLGAWKAHLEAWRERPDHLKIGDKVLVTATVVETYHPEQVLLEFFSKTDQYNAWVHRDYVEKVLP